MLWLKAPYSVLEISAVLKYRYHADTLLAGNAMQITLIIRMRFALLVVGVIALIVGLALLTALDFFAKREQSIIELLKNTFSRR